MPKFVFDFSAGNAEKKDLLGGKGANLSEMTKLGFPVPPGFTISTEACNKFLENQKNFPENLEQEIENEILNLEKKTGKKFNDQQNPLLVSVRSGAKISMPGMMDTVLNLGMNEEVEKTMAIKTNNPKFAADCHRRFVQMFCDVVWGISGEVFEEEISKQKKILNIKLDTEFSVQDLQNLTKKFKKIAQEKTNKKFPENPREQLKEAICAVFCSWNSARAKKYRQLNKIPDNLGTAVNVQVMVFGNLGENSGTGVFFTRNPSTGEKQIFGDFLLNAQGEDVVAGIRTPREINELKNEMPKVFSEILNLSEKLENHFREMQDIEFTIENKKLFLLQTRTGKRTAAAAIKIAVDLVEENKISKQEAILRIDTENLDSLLHPSIDPNFSKKVLSTGIAASPGAASGKVVFSAEKAVEMSEKGENTILVRHETSPEDIAGMAAAKGILTSCGGKASHAAVVARGMGKPCVAGASAIIINSKLKKFSIDKKEFFENEEITIDGGTGEIFLGIIPKIPAKISDNFKKILNWSDQFRKIKIFSNADTPKDAEKSLEFGGEGIGLCRTEHMFFDENRIHFVRKMILAKSKKERKDALQKILPFQKDDFLKIFEKMDGFPVTIRFLDPPLHEFLPEKNREIEQIAQEFELGFEEVKDRIKNLSEVNPMLGLRGCRLLITFPEILEMQTQAVLEAAIEIQSLGKKVLPELMIPLVGRSEELKFCRHIIEQVAEKIFDNKKNKVDFKIGTMIEIPRACVSAGEIAQFADFFSFGTNDLTQMTFGFSRDDIGQFLPQYLNKKILPIDPFESVDQSGIGELIKIGVSGGRQKKPNLKISVCGEHGGDPNSIYFFVKQNFSAVSCSPFRVPIARIAAAQAEIMK